LIRLAVVDDHPAVRVSYADYLGAYPDIEVIGEAANGHDAVELCRESTPDVVLMDIRMPVMDGIEATRLIKKVSPSTRVILVSAYEQDELVDSGHAAGADLFVLKGISGAELARSVSGLGGSDA
jgi:DNA-binding NarL/FixJ family response regulator